MRILLGDKFKLRPVSALTQEKKPHQAKYMIGTVIDVQPRHGFALLQFEDGFRECFSFYGDKGLLKAQRVGEHHFD